MAQHSYQLFSISNGSLPVSTTSASPSQTITRASEAELELLFNHIPEFIKTPDNTTRAAYQRNAQAILVRVCRSIERENYKSYRIFLEDLLDLNFKAWESNKDLSHAQNPISLVLVKVKTDPPIADVLWILIDYCIQMAKEEEDYRYVSPVTSTLRGIIELNDQHRDIVHDTLKGLAFIPVKDKAEIVSLAAVAHSLKFPWPLRKVDTRSIYECQSKSPVFRKGEQKIDQGDHKFAHDVYEASYDMLWTVSGSESKLGGPPPKQTWFHILFYTILFKCGVRSKVNVKCYDFNRDMLDNPAIIALLEYKWNTIGHAYWLVRFYALFLFYFLVLGATIVQVWGRVSRVSLFSGYIVIIVMALVFLMFKVVYYCRRRRPICTDDIVDILVFVLPIIGSGMQIVNIMKMNEKGNISILSFSVLAIFLHFLFEFRVKKNICYIVTVILEIVVQIRFFLIVYTLGIIAFALTIVHFLRGCPISDCGGLVDESFTKAPFRAITTTFLLLSGYWGSFGGSLELEGRDWGFDLIMVLYVVMMAMISLNILIALMNDGFKDARELLTPTWIQFKLSYVEEAEAIAYNIPGFREADGKRLPKEIYYTATLQQKKDYEKRFQKDQQEKQIEFLMAAYKELKRAQSQAPAVYPGV